MEELLVIIYNKDGSDTKISHVARTFIYWNDHHSLRVPPDGHMSLPWRYVYKRFYSCGELHIESLWGKTTEKKRTLKDRIANAKHKLKLL